MNDLLVSGGFLLIAAACLAIAAFGCAHAPAPSATVLATGTSSTIYEIPVEQVKEKEIGATPGKDIDDVIMDITVPPSDKPTNLKIHKRPKPLSKDLKEAFTGDSGSPDYALTSDNKDAKGRTEKHIGLWPWFAGIGAGLAGFFALRKWLQRFGWITKIISWAGKLF